MLWISLAKTFMKARPACCGVESFMRQGKQCKDKLSEPYVCLSQGQAKRPAQLVAMQWKHMVEVNNKIAEPRPGYSPGPAYGTAL